MKSPIDTKQDRRRFFRIIDAIAVRYQQLDDAANPVTGQGDKTEDLISQYNQSIQQALAALHQQQPALAELVALLNKKVDLFASLAALEYRSAANDVRDIEAASLSACGIAFPVSQHFPVGALLSLTLFLKPSDVEIEAQGRVISCRAIGGEQTHYLRVEFTEIYHQGREKLIQHIVLRQGVMLKELREQME
ncbi:MAG: PilZ domain-containing protein [Cellvibrionaceae bacterium]|nr:PilZ domain-containing protein [Cellvibrionaceae bacterium]